jgi:Arc/MetJ-type ribon-helix-helix transcriptional regulator
MSGEPNGTAYAVRRFWGSLTGGASRCARRHPRLLLFVRFADLTTGLRAVIVCITGEIHVRETITISLPKEIKEELDRVTKRERVTRSDVVRESLRDYLFLRQFRSLRTRMVAKAQSRGVYTDQDVFDRVS